MNNNNFNIPPPGSSSASPLMFMPPPTSLNQNTGPMAPYLMNAPTSSSHQPQAQSPNDSSLDLSRPPPGFTQAIPQNLSASDSKKPPEMPHIDMPYYHLPAGLMVDLIKLEDDDYEPIDTNLVKLPTLQTPSEKLLKAVEDFYNLSNPAKTRNALVNI